MASLLSAGRMHVNPAFRSASIAYKPAGSKSPLSVTEEEHFYPSNGGIKVDVCALSDPHTVSV